MESLLPENQEFWRIDAIPLQFFLEHRHSYPSRDELRRVQRSVLQHVLLGHGNDDASRLCSLHHCMHLSWSNNIFVSLRRFIARVVGKDDDDEAADDKDIIRRRRRRRNKHVRTDEGPTAEEVWRTIQKQEMRNDINWWKWTCKDFEYYDQGFFKQWNLLERLHFYTSIKQRLTFHFFVQNPTCFKGEENDFNVNFWNLNKVLEI